MDVEIINGSVHLRVLPPSNTVVAKERLAKARINAPRKSIVFSFSHNP